MQGALELNGLRLGLGRNQDRGHANVVTCIVKILQIQRVIPDLIQGRDIELRFACLELDYEQDMAHEENHIGASAKAWDGVFKVDLRLTAL